MRCVHCRGTDLVWMWVDETIWTAYGEATARMLAQVCHTCGETYIGGNEFQRVEDELDYSEVLRVEREALERGDGLVGLEEVKR